MSLDHPDVSLALKAAVRSFCGDDEVVVHDVSFSDGSKMGDGYTSCIRSVEVVYGPQHKRACFKLKMPMESNASWWSKMRLFDREIEFYAGILPKMKSFCDVLYGKDDHPFVKIYYTSKDAQVIVMEDLKEQNFKLCHDDDPALTNALDVVQVKLILEELAKFHAVGYHLLKTYPGGTEAFDRHFQVVAKAGKLGLFMTEDEAVRMQQTSTYQAVMNDVLSTLRASTLSPTLVDRFEAFLPTAIARCGSSRDPKDHAFSVVAHGDFWSNNILFRKDTAGNIDAVKFIDFQECMRSRPTTDLACLLATSVLPKLRQDHLGEWLTHYHKILGRALRDLGYAEEIYTYEQLVKDFKDNYGHGFYWGVINAQTTLSSDSKDLSEILGLSSASSQETKGASTGKERIGALIQEAAEYGLL